MKKKRRTTVYHDKQAVVVIPGRKKKELRPAHAHKRNILSIDLIGRMDDSGSFGLHAKAWHCLV